jgi:hypothetical protein
MGYKKSATHHRDEISGLHVHDDIQDGTHGAEDLAARNAARQADLNAAIKRDWPANQTASIPEHSDPTLGNAFSRLPKPSDYIVGSKAPRFGASAEDDTNPSTQGGQPQKPSKQKGIEEPKKRG